MRHIRVSRGREFRFASCSHCGTHIAMTHTGRTWNRTRIAAAKRYEAQRMKQHRCA